MPHTLQAIAELEMIAGFDDDLARETTRVANRLHDLSTGSAIRRRSPRLAFQPTDPREILIKVLASEPFPSSF